MAAVENIDICLCIFCGLPGAGKTTLCNNLMKTETYSFIHVCYDNLLPWINFSDPDSLLTWKKYRNAVLEFVKFLVTIARLKSANSLLECPTLLIQDSAVRVFDATKEIISSTFSKKVVFLIDDNMPYRRMRYEYFQIARQLNTGCCTVMVECPFVLCLKRNQTRPVDEIVRQKSLRRINAQMEKPDIQKASWEKHFCTIDTVEGDAITIVNEVLKTIQCAFDQQAKSLPMVDTDAIKESRVKNPSNLKHQADLCLRKLSNEIIKQQSNPKLIAERLNVAKKYILNEIKSGVVDESDFIDKSGNIKQQLLKLKMEELLKTFLEH